MCMFALGNMQYMQGGNGSPPPPFVHGMSRRGQGGGGEAGEEDGRGNNRRNGIPPSTLSRFDANLHIHHPQRQGATDGSAAAGDGWGGGEEGRAGLRSTSQSTNNWRDDVHNRNSDHNGPSAGTSVSSRYPTRRAAATAAAAAGGGTASPSWSWKHSAESYPTMSSSGRDGALAAERKRALSAAGRSEDDDGMMRPVLFGHRAGGGGGGSVGEHQSEVYDDAEYRRDSGEMNRKQR